MNIKKFVNVKRIDSLPGLLLLSLLAGCIEVDMSVPSFPDIASAFRVSEGIVQRTITFNFLGFVIGALIYGPLSESYGRRKVMLAGCFLMFAGAVGCVFASGIDALLFFRFLQGVGACAPVVITFAIISDRYEGVKAYALFGLVNAFMSIAMSIAPVIGGWVNLYLGWRGNYAIVAGITLLSLGMLVLFLPETRKKKEPISMKFLTDSYIKLIKSKTFLCSSLVPSLFFSAYMVFVASCAFVYQETFGLSVEMFVVHFFMIVASFAITSLMSARLIFCLGGPEKTEKYGICLATLSTVLLLLVDQSAVLLTLIMCLFCVGFALFYPIVFARSMNVYPDIFGVTSAFNMSSRSLLVVSSTALSSYFFSGEVRQITYIMLAITLLASLIVIAFYVNKEKSPQKSSSDLSYKAP